MLNQESKHTKRLIQRGKDEKMKVEKSECKGVDSFSLCLISKIKLPKKSPYFFFW